MGKYWGNRGNYDYSKINVIIVSMENYGNIYPPVIMGSPIFPIFPNTLVPFLHEQNHLKVQFPNLHFELGLFDP